MRAGPVARAQAWLTAVLETIVGAIMLAAVVINFANVVARYVFFRPIVWAEEAMQFSNVWVVMLGAAIVTRYHGHLQMDALSNLMPRRLRRVVDILLTVLTLVLSGYIIVEAARVIALMVATGQSSVIAGIPMRLVYLAIPLGFGCGLLLVARRLWMLLVHGEAEKDATPSEGAV